MQKFDKTIIAIHGVGEAKIGDILKALCANLSLGKVQLNDILVDDYCYKEVQSSKYRTNIIETNWSDVLKPKKTWFSIIKHAFMVIVAMLSFAEKDTNSKILGKINPISIFRFLLEGFMLGAISLQKISSIGVAMNNKEDPNLLLGVSLMFLIVILFGFITFKGIKYSNYFKVGILHLIVIIIIGAISYFFQNIGEIINPYCNYYRDGVLMLTSGVWFVYTIYSLILYFVSRPKTFKILTKLAFITLPFIAFSAYGTILNLIYLFLIDKEGKNTLPFDLFKMEIATTITYSLIGIIPLFFVIKYLLYKPIKSQSFTNNNKVNEQGYIAQKGIKYFLFTLPLLLVLLAIYIVILRSEGCKIDDNLLYIYRISILRIMPFLAWLIGPLAILIDVIGDILFYINPDIGSKYSTKIECKNRVKKIIDSQLELGNSEIIILAHSWGTVLAADVIKENNYNCKLITLGSPIQSLCLNFLGISIPKVKTKETWINVYRNGDYVGGPIYNQSTLNVNIEEGGHTDYWSSGKVGELIKKELE